MSDTKARIIERLTGFVAGKGQGDFELNPALWLEARDLKEEELRPAAVLVPLVERPEGLTVLLTKRTDHLYDHAGQISFPGGRVEPDDENAIATALRETEEEIGVGPEHIEIVGEIDTYMTGTGFSITPVVGFVSPDYTLQIDEFEVAEVFEVPLAFVMDPDNHERRSAVYKGVERHFYVLPYEDRYIWGATAGMLVSLHARVMGPVLVE
ncbi:MAG: CoA pyrophosphatase [Alphaproteobacteria bacterium]|jgi:8-oxo-dGTP pyrophosphatase MutT (NUDIX family)|nr:CoA pyrophosphatase [Alphaproteobacteria bacterium]MBT4082952.1 CoA pyrophosphatase [Alphaproteobacteria bacterium]MBT4544848.1 CoA pyrophosphatase [Alphaproteobacteria bacterium]MBT5917857.1 CoA pyrophosphatase [Alphaproteobacteria bacterium]MBT6384689.1 CoA pyrophosphatase [Alphaproteobacteria bacterium]